MTIGTSDIPEDVTDDYTELTSYFPYFLGLIESTTNPGKIGRAFACIVENGTPFCLEGGINESSLDTKPVYESNQKIMYENIANCNIDLSNDWHYCDDDGNSNVSINISNSGYVEISDGNEVCWLSHGRLECPTNPTF